MKKGLGLYAEGINGIVNNGKDSLSIDLVGVDYKMVIDEMIFELGFDEVLELLDFNKLAEYVTERIDGDE